MELGKNPGVNYSILSTHFVETGERLLDGSNIGKLIIGHAHNSIGSISNYDGLEILNELTNLELIDPVNVTDFTFLEKMSSLKTLRITGAKLQNNITINGVQKSNLEAIGSLVKLESLYLDGNDLININNLVKNTNIEEQVGLCSLIYLNFNNNISLTDLGELINLKILETLYLKNCALTEDNCNILFKMNYTNPKNLPINEVCKLKRLYLHDGNVSLTNTAALSDLQNLTWLNESIR